jgi:kynurenine 3-monooxygenase
VLLLGDAAHAVSASVGQSCNSASQDVQVFWGLLEQYQNDSTKALPAYTTERLADAHAVSDLSDYSTPQSKCLKFEWIMGTILKKAFARMVALVLAANACEALVRNQAELHRCIGKNKMVD